MPKAAEPEDLGDIQLDEEDLAARLKDVNFIAMQELIERNNFVKLN